MTRLRPFENTHHSCSSQQAPPDIADDASSLSESFEQAMNSKVEVSVPAESEEPHKTPRKRLKIEPENAQSEAQVSKPNRPDKYVRGRRGHLKLMTEMPLDTLHEIFRQLGPLDLLYLSWANKSLRGILMEKAAKYIWEEVSSVIFPYNDEVSDHILLHRHMNGFMNQLILHRAVQLM